MRLAVHRSASGQPAQTFPNLAACLPFFSARSFTV
jgi:hypothetical protein